MLRSRIHKYVAGALLFLVSVSLAGVAQAERRVALVIGNAAYENATPLKNPVNDANDVAASLTGLGFDVVLGTDLNYRAFRGKIREFSDKLVGADVGLLFYAGHGVQVAGRNYVAPIDVTLKSEVDIDIELIAIDIVLKQMEREAKTNIVLLDACRDNPLARTLARTMGTRSTAVGSGLARIESGIGTFIAFATQPGNVAYDGEGRNSPFTAALVKHIGAGGLSITSMMIRVRNEVHDATGGRQVPWENSSLLGQFYFQPEAPKQVAEPTPADAGDQAGQKVLEYAYWQEITNSTDPKAFGTFLEKFPNGVFADLAQRRIASLNAAAKDSAASVSVASAPDTQPAARDATPAPKAAEAEESAAETKVAALSKSDAPAKAEDDQEKAAATRLELARALQGELNRVGCDAGTVDGVWGSGSQKALDRFVRYAKITLDAEPVSAETLARLREQSGRVCPLTCGARFYESGGKCVRKTCGAGEVLNRKGNCVSVRAKIRAKAIQNRRSTASQPSTTTQSRTTTKPKTQTPVIGERSTY
ncbi:MAG: caspase family protein [Hyphomicrobiales bacterium]|nr:caspase family protein [Hyphomicrobiales bacterium]